MPLADRNETVLTGRLSLAAHPWLADHTIGECAIVPGTAFLELAQAAARHVGAAQVVDLSLEAPLPLPASGALQVQVTVGAPDACDQRSLTLHARADPPDGDPGPWTRHASGALGTQAPEPRSQNSADQPTAWPPAGATPDTVPDVYAELAERGYDYGPAFRNLTACWRRGQDRYVEVRLLAEQAVVAERCTIHPALLDAVLHPLAADATRGGTPTRSGSRSPGPASRCTPPARPNSAPASTPPARTPWP